jgi:hypothetical protein
MLSIWIGHCSWLQVSSKLTIKRFTIGHWIPHKFWGVVNLRLKAKLLETIQRTLLLLHPVEGAPNAEGYKLKWPPAEKRAAPFICGHRKATACHQLPDLSSWTTALLVMFTSSFCLLRIHLLRVHRLFSTPLPRHLLPLITFSDTWTHIFF